MAHFDVVALLSFRSSKIDALSRFGYNLLCLLNSI
jgi:hypothetical protein